MSFFTLASVFATFRQLALLKTASNRKKERVYKYGEFGTVGTDSSLVGEESHFKSLVKYHSLINQNGVFSGQILYLIAFN